MAPGARPAASAVAEPSAIGRRASPLGWLAVVLGAGAFLAASIAVIVLTGIGTGGGASALNTGPGAVTLARFDSTLYDGGSVTADEPFEIEVEAINAADATTAPLWLVIDWRPDDLASSPGVRGSFVACEPEDCTASDERDAARTVVSWPGLTDGERRVLRVRVIASGIEPGTTLRYRVSTGSGETEPAMEGGHTWDLDLEVQ